MAVSPIKTVRIVANTSNKNFPTVNIVATAMPNAKQHGQVTGSNYGSKFASYQDSGGSVKGLKTIYIPGYAGPG